MCGRSQVAARQGRWEVISQMGDVQCPRCEDVFITEFDAVRIRSGSFHDSERNESFDQLCEDCYREVVK